MFAIFSRFQKFFKLFLVIQKIVQLLPVFQKIFQLVQIGQVGKYSGKLEKGVLFVLLNRTIF